MCIWVLVWWRLVRRCMNVLRLTSNLFTVLRCGRLRASECGVGPVSSCSGSLLYSHCYWTEHSRTLHLCSGIRDSEQLLQPLESFISYKQEFSLDSRGRCLKWINQGFTVAGSRFCGYNHYWQQQPELTAWSWPLTSSPFGVATPLTTAHLDVLWMCQF